MPDKTIGGWLVIDWKNETHRTRKSKPKASNLGPNELLAELSIDVHVPDVAVPTLPVTVEATQPQVLAAELEGLDPEDLPDWTDVASDYVDERREDIGAVSGVDGDWDAFARLRAEIVTEVLRDAPGRPDVKAVEELVEDAMLETLETDGREDGVAGGAE